WVETQVPFTYRCRKRVAGRPMVYRRAAVFGARAATTRASCGEMDGMSPARERGEVARAPLSRGAIARSTQWRKTNQTAAAMGGGTIVGAVTEKGTRSGKSGQRLRNCGRFSCLAT